VETAAEPEEEINHGTAGPRMESPAVETKVLDGFMALEKIAQ
jgi:hypothetical protein